MSVGHIEVESENNVHVLAMYGEHDISTAPELRLEIERIADAGDDVIVDLSEAEFIDSSIVGVLVDGYRRAPTDGGRGSFVAVAAPGGPVARLFDLVSISDLIPLYPTRAAALSAASGFGGVVTTVRTPSRPECRCCPARCAPGRPAL